MKISPETLILQIFSVVASYLILSVTFVGAYEINVFGDNDQDLAEITGFSEFLDKDFEFYYDYARNAHFMKVSLESLNESVQMRKVYFYVCRDYNPVQCILRGDPPHIGTSTSGYISIMRQ